MSELKAFACLTQPWNERRFTTMVSAAEKTLYKRLASLPAWEVAKHFGCDYSGDGDAIEHGGFFYDARDWESGGYASVVEFYHDDEHDQLVVQRGTVNRPDNLGDLAAAIGDLPDDVKGNIHAQIEACRYYTGIEPDDGQYTRCRTFKTATWREWRIWQAVASWLKSLGE